MARITLYVEDNTARAKVDDGPITAGSVGIPVDIVTDEEWIDLRWTLVCMTALDRIPINQPNEETSKVPWELLIQGYHLYIGLEGRNAEGDLIQNSTLADCGKIAASSEGSHTGNPTPNEMEQLMNIAENIILVQDEQPVQRENKAWVKQQEEEFDVPEWEDVAKMLNLQDTLIQVSETQPETPETKIWVPTEFTETDIPDWAEFKALEARVQALEQKLK